MVAIERPRLEPPSPGRPSIYTPELADAILDRLAAGESLRQVCTAESMPDRSTVLRWLTRHEDFQARYQRAREVQADAWLDAIADHLRTPPARDPVTGCLDPVAVRHHRNVAGSYRWFMDKLRPRLRRRSIGPSHAEFPLPALREPRRALVPGR